MATINYRDPGTGLWTELSTPVGAPGPTGPTGGIGLTVASVDPGNAAIIGTDGGIYVATVAQADTDPLYVNVGGDTMTGALLLPDQTVTPPMVPAAAIAKGYVDQLITVSDVDPAGVPVRDGLIWAVTGEVPLAPPTSVTGVYVDAITNTLTWVDSTDTVTYEIRYNTTGAVVGGADTLLATGIAAGVGTAAHTKNSAEQTAPLITYGIRAVSPGEASVWVPAAVAMANNSAGGNPIALCQTGAGIGENFLTVGGEWVTTPIDGFFGSLEPKGDGAFTITFPAGDYQSTEELGVVGVWGVDPADHLDWADASVVTNMPYYFTDSEVTMTGGPLLATGAAEPIGWGYLLVWSGWISENYVLDSYGHQGLFTHAGYTWGVDSPWNLCGTDYFAALTGTPPAQEPGWFYTIAYGFCLVDYTVPVPFVIDVTRAGQARTNIPAGGELSEQEQYDRDLQRLVMEGWTEVLLGKRWPKQESFDAMVELGRVEPQEMEAYLERKYPHLRAEARGD